MSKGLSAAWLAEYRKSGSLYTTLDCGCLAWVMVDMPSEVKAAQGDIAAQALKGRTIRRCAKADLPPLNCAAHSKADR